MKVKAFNRISFAVTVASCTLILPSPAFAANYVVTDLGTLGGDFSSASDLNAAAQVVGVASTTDGQEHAFLWDDGVMTDLGTLGGTNSHAGAINSSGTVVGWAETPDGRIRACLFGSTTNTDLSGDYLDNSFAADINDQGRVVGWTETPVAGADQPRPTAVFYGANNPKVQNLSVWNGNPVSGRANAINNSNVVAGWTIGDGNIGWLWAPHVQATFWHSLTASDFTSFSAIDSHMLGINEEGESVGESGYSYASQRATCWSGTNQVNLGSLTVGSSSARNINSARQIVGTSSAYRFGFITNPPISLPGFPPPEPKVFEGYIPTYHAFLWQGGVMVDLNDLTPTNSGWELTDATAINDAGQIVGAGTLDGRPRAFLLTPETNPNQLPFVHVTSPSDGEWISGTNVTLQAEAHDPDGHIQRVEFFANRVARRDPQTGGFNVAFLGFTLYNPAHPPGYLGTVTNAPFVLDVSSLAAGNYLIVAKATDGQGLTACSAEVLLRFNSPPFLSMYRGPFVNVNPPTTPDRRLTLQFSANEEAQSDIQTSTDLVHWMKLDRMEIPSPSQSLVHILTVQEPTNEHLFYRVVCTPPN